MKSAFYLTERLHRSIGDLNILDINKIIIFTRPFSLKLRLHK